MVSATATITKSRLRSGLGRLEGHESAGDMGKPGLSDATEGRNLPAAKDVGMAREESNQSLIGAAAESSELDGLDDRCCPIQGTICDARELPEGWRHYPQTLKGYRFSYSWRQATYSIIETNHNETWMIWSDLGPLLLFVSLFFANISSAPFWHRPLVERLLLCGVYLAIVACRLCSSGYHVYRCVSVRMSQTLINIDMIGISSMAFGSPWIFGVASKSFELTPGMQAYISVMAVSWVACCLLFGYAFVAWKSGPKWTAVQQPVLVIFAAIGNFPALQACADSTTPSTWRLCLFLGFTGFLVGYIVFFKLHVPECWMKAGEADGKYWNSHVIWHVLVGLSQLSYIITTFLPPLEHVDL